MGLVAEIGLFSAEGIGNPRKLGRAMVRATVDYALQRAAAALLHALAPHHGESPLRRMAQPCGFEPSVERRGRDLNPRRACTLNGFRDRPVRPLRHPSERVRVPPRPTGNGEGGIRTLEAGITPPNALAGRRLQPLGHFSG